MFEVVTPTDQKLGLASSGTATLEPAATKSVSHDPGGFSDIEILHDGKTLTLLGKDANLYAQAVAPGPGTGTVDQLIDRSPRKHNRPLPVADLLMSNPYEELIQDVYDAKDLGSGVINGVERDYR